MTWSVRTHRLVAVVFDVLGERLELGFLEQLTESALAVPIWGEVLAVMLAQVLDLRGGMLVIDLPALFASTAVQARILRGVAHTNSFRTHHGPECGRAPTTKARPSLGIRARRGPASGETAMRAILL